jgi:DsbC/DsbD-like thiol-disulfide interchange protein
MGEIIWPVPSKIFVEPLANYGYHEKVTLLQNLTVPQTLPEGIQNPARQNRYAGL